MNDKSERLFACLTDISDEFIDEAAERLKPVSHKRRYVAIAAALVAIIGLGRILVPWILMGIFGGGGAGGEGRDNSSSIFMSYAGPVLPLTLKEENSSITAQRNITLDFSLWEKDYNRSTDMLVYDQYTLSNSSPEAQTVTVLYPFTVQTSDLGLALSSAQPTLTVDDAKAVTKIYVGDIYTDPNSDAYPNWIGSEHILNSWDDYELMLSGTEYMENALADYPDFSDIPAVVYEFSEPWGPEANHDDIPNPTINISFNLDYDKTTVLTCGFNGVSSDVENGKMIQQFSIPTRPADYGKKYIIVLGDDIQNIDITGYATGGFDTKDTINAGVTSRRYETDLEQILSKIARCYNIPRSYSEFERNFGLMKRQVLAEVLAPGDSPWNYGTGWIEDLDISAYNRVLYAETEITIPAESSVELMYTMEKKGSFDYACANTKNRGIYGYDVSAKLGSNIAFTEQTATIEDYGFIEIVRQNFGFDLDANVKTVQMSPDVDHYYLEVKRIDVQYDES